MTISAVVPDIAFAGSSGSGTMGPFSLIKNGTPLVFFANSEVVVLRYDSVTDTTPTLLVEGTDYTLTGGPTAGSITLTSPQTGLLTAERLYVTTVSALAQTLDLVNGGNFSSSNLERRLDVIFQILQQHAREIKSTMRFAMFDTDEIPKTTPLGAVLDKIPYVTGTASAPTVAYLDALVLNDLSELGDENLANIATVAADLAGADTIGIVAAAIDDVEAVAANIGDVATVANAVVDGTLVVVKDTYAALTAIPAADRSDNMVVYVASRSTDGDGGAGWWRFDAGSSATANGGTILAPNAGTGRWIRQYTGAVNVCWFGAVGDGTTDSQAAFNAAAPFNMVYVPAGTYVLSATWTFTDKNVFIFGDGRATTVLKFSGTTRGIYVNNANTFAAVDIHDIGIKTTATSPTGTAIEIVWPETFDGRQIHKGLISGCQIEGFTNTTMGWAKGIRYTQGCMVTVRDCGLLGKDTNGSSSSAQADKTASSIAIEFVGGVFPVELRVVGCYGSCWDTGVKSTGAPEGIYFNNSVLINVRAGLDIEPTTFSAGIGGGSALYRPLLSVADSHIAAWQYAVRVYGMIQSYIHDNLFYFQDGGSQNGELLHLEQAGGVHVHNNGFYYFGTTRTCTGIVAENNSATVANIIDRNSFGSMDKGIWLKSTAGLTWLKANIAEGTYTNGFIDDDSTATILGQRTVWASLTTAQSIANNTNTPIVFDTEQRDNWGGFTASDDAIIIGGGVAAVQARAIISWAGNATGYRQVEIKLNNVSLTPPALRFLNPGADVTVMELSTGILKVVSGDQITVDVLQTSGGALNAQGAGRCQLIVTEVT